MNKCPTFAKLFLVRHNWIEKTFMGKLKIKLAASVFLLFVCLSVNAQGQLKSEEAYVVIKAFLQTVKQVYTLDIRLRAKPFGEVNFDQMLSRMSYDHNPHMEINIDSILSEEDFEYMRCQVKKVQKLIQLDSGLLKKYKITQNSHPTGKSEIALLLSFPFFSIKGDVALLYVEHWKGEGVGGGRFVFLRKDSNGSWLMISSVPAWMT